MQRADRSQITKFLNTPSCLIIPHLCQTQRSYCTLLINATNKKEPGLSKCASSSLQLPSLKSNTEDAGVEAQWPGASCAGSIRRAMCGRRAVLAVWSPTPRAVFFSRSPGLSHWPCSTFSLLLRLEGLQESPHQGNCAF